MYRLLTGLRLVGLGIYTDTPHADGGAGGGAPSGSGAGSPPAGDLPTAPETGSDAGFDDVGGVDDTPARDAQPGDAEPSLDDLMDDDGDDPVAGRTPEQRIAALLETRKKLRRSLRKMAPVYERVKDADLDRVLTNARQYEALVEAARDPEAHAQVLRALGITGSPAEPAAPSGAKPGRFDLENLPFDPKANPVNELFYQMARTINELQDRVDGAERVAKGADSRLSQQAAERVKAEWSGVIHAMLSQVPPGPNAEGVKVMIQDAMRAAYRDEELNRLAGRKAHSAAFVSNFYLKKLGINPETQRRMAAAVKQRAAEKVNGLPRQLVRPGVPAAPNADVKVDMAEARRRITGAR